MTMERSFLGCARMQMSGAPERIRTSDPCLRRAVLYPAELRARGPERRSTFGAKMIRAPAMQRHDAPWELALR